MPKTCIAISLIAFAVALVPSRATAQIALADAASKPLAFDVVSVRQNTSKDERLIDNSPKDGFSVTNVPLNMLISNAYGIHWDLTSGAPRWVESTRYDIVAKVLSTDSSFKELTPDQRNEMIRTLLAERFNLKAHIEMKELPAYNLVIAKDGPRLKEDTSGARNSLGMSPGSLHVVAGETSQLADVLGLRLQRSVIDKTGLTGRYTYQLRWTPDSDAPPSPTTNGQPDTVLPSLFTAVQEQLGLRLDPTKAPTKTLVIDHIDQLSEN